MSEQHASEATPDDHAPEGTPRSVSETERKYRVHGLYRLPDLVGAGAVAAVDDLGVASLDATYFHSSSSGSASTASAKPGSWR